MKLKVNPADLTEKHASLAHVSWKQNGRKTAPRLHHTNKICSMVNWQMKGRIKHMV